MAREHQPLVHREFVIGFVVIAFEAGLPVNRLLGADESDLQIAERNAVVGVQPAAQHCARDFHRNAADRRALPDPARRRIADPCLAIALVHVLDRDAADPVREVVILRGCDCRRQPAQAKLLQARDEALLLLLAKHAEHELLGGRNSAPHDHAEDQSGEERVIEIGDAAPARPLRCIRMMFSGLHCLVHSSPSSIGGSERAARF